MFGRSTTAVDVQILTPEAPGWNGEASGVLSEEELDTWRSLRQAEDRDCYVLVHARLRLALGELLNVAPASIQFSRAKCPQCAAPHGRPRTLPYRGVEFSISRTPGLVAVATAPTPVGVDVQRFPPFVSQGILDQLHPREIEALSELRGTERVEHFTRCWVRKEALLKATGAGIGHGLDRDLVGAGADPHPSASWHLQDLPAPPGYAAACATILGPSQR